ncbi:MAG TPA: carboxypeptidase regulatory-like domain-containing protein [Candidatus Acidoferrales bacterium]|nr:carboxypeptidase regulatory-like domain-containing protein [Candidatus Acidoferrales bacterium]
MSRYNVLPVAFLLCLSVIHGQTPDTALVHGQVLDQSRAGVSGVAVTVKNTQTGLERTTQTDAAGNFSLAGLPVAGAYDITATKTGFADAQLKGVTLAGGTTADFNLQLNVASGQSQITVTGVMGEIRTDAPQLGTLLDATQIEETPLLSRRITFLPMLNAANRPAINQGDVFMNQNLFTSNGAGRRQAWFEVDGTTGNDSWGRQTIFSNIPVAALQEMAVLTNAFTAEYGGSTGSVVNIVTKTGGSQLHGELMELWRPSATAAALSGFTSTNAASGNDLTYDTLGQSAASLSGPLGTGGGRTHFFLAGEFSRENKSSPIISPVAPGAFVGHYRGWLGDARIDHQINDNHNLFFRGNMDGFHDTNPNGAVGGNNLPSVDRIFRRRTYSAELGETAVLTSNIINNARVQFQLASPITEFDPVIFGTQYQVPISAGGTFTTGTSQSALLMNRQYQVNDTLSAVWGRHQVKFGVDMILAHTGGNSKEFGGPIYLGQFVYNTCTLSLAACEGPAYLNNIANVRTYTQSYGNANYTVDDTLWSLFVQDDIRLRPDLTVNIGLRYEQQTFADSRRDFAPRVGFSYNVRGDGKTVIRGGFGIYYSQIVDNSAANWALTGPTGVFNYTAAPGQVGFPGSVAAVPLPVFPAGAPVPLRSLYVRPGDSANLNRFFPTSTLMGYQDKLMNPYSEQWSFGIERRLATDWVLAVDYVGSHTLKINRPLDVDPPTPFPRTAPGQIRTAQAANCTRPYWIAFYQQQGTVCNTAAATNPQPPYSTITSDVNNGYAYYDALDVNLTHRFSNHLSMLASYTWSHAIDNVDPDIPGQNPNDPNFTGKVENGNAIYDQRQRFVLSGVWVAPFQVHIGGVATLATGLPYNITTGTTNSGDTGATADRPVINGVVIGRNTGRGYGIYDFAPFIERPFALPFAKRGESVRLDLRAEAFNVFNHPNFAGYSGTYGNGATAGAGFGTPLVGITNQFPARSLQFSAKFRF